MAAVKAVREHGSVTEAAKALGIPRKTLDDRYQYGISLDAGLKGPGTNLQFDQDVRASKLIITSAQNATPVHQGFLKTLKIYAAHIGAQLVVIPIRHKNPTSIWTASQRGDEIWAREVVPFLCNQRKRLHEHLILLADIKTVPTAEDPLSGFDAMTHNESGILGHSRLQFKTVATPRNTMAKIMTTTGSVTVHNYTDTKLGKKGDFHHVFGACLVEIDDDIFHLRQIIAEKDGSFIDAETCVTPRGIKAAPRAAGIVFGDIHYGSVDPDVERATFGEGGIVPTLRPKTLVFNDLLDCYARNPHHRDNVFSEIAKRSQGKHDMAAEVAGAAQYAIDRVPEDSRGVIVASNHDDMLARWIRDTDWRRDPDNAAFYLDTAKAMVESTRLGKGGLEVVQPFAYWVRRMAGENGRVRCLAQDESYEIEGIEVGQHGDRGPNGARGTIKNFRNIGPKVIIGHSHSPGINQGAYQTGTSTYLRLEYNSGPSSWLQTHVVIYSNGKRCLLTIVKGRWRARQESA